MVRPKKESAYKTVYLPPVYDSKKFREGVIEIINMVQALRLIKAEKAKLETISDTLEG